ncbi:unnamed protein product [Polarella glacialis]|uniref:C3H1-type domain-containing protein n=1 Tax=Polarella glacialis TaxID=89957 RepID=A0A813H1W4_POLGL|nr:unnamed protein product [Polarella glacialis]
MPKGGGGGKGKADFKGGKGDFKGGFKGGFKGDFSKGGFKGDFSKGKGPPTAFAPGLQPRKRPFEGDVAEGGGAPKRFKSQMCAFFGVGRCAKGDDCTWAHAEHEISGELGVPPAHFMQEPEVVAMPAGYKRRLCEFFLAAGTCKKGSECNFAHGEHEMGGAPVLCEFFMAGTCKKGPECTFAHGEHEMGGAPVHFYQEPEPVAVPAGYKRRLCEFFLAGSCKKGPECTFAHGEHEMGGAPVHFYQEPAPPCLRLREIHCCSECDMGPSCPGPACASGITSRLASASKYWEMGTCQKGDGCQFAHGGEEMGAPPGFGAPSYAKGGGGKGAFKGFQGGGSWEPPAPVHTQTYVGPKFKTQMCKFFEEGTCKKGGECNYAPRLHVVIVWVWLLLLLVLFRV